MLPTGQEARRTQLKPQNDGKKFSFYRESTPLDPFWRIVAVIEEGKNWNCMVNSRDVAHERNEKKHG
jgi:hypothetical protein